MREEDKLIINAATKLVKAYRRLQISGDGEPTVAEEFRDQLRPLVQAVDYKFREAAKRAGLVVTR